jgi:hypothetical protein
MFSLGRLDSKHMQYRLYVMGCKRKKSNNRSNQLEVRTRISASSAASPTLSERQPGVRSVVDEGATVYLQKAVCVPRLHIALHGTWRRRLQCESISQMKRQCLMGFAREGMTLRGTASAGDGASHLSTTQEPPSFSTSTSHHHELPMCSDYM